MEMGPCCRTYYWVIAATSDTVDVVAADTQEGGPVGPCGSLQAPRKQADLLASGSPHAVLTQPELANVIMGLFVVNSSLIEMYK